MLAIDEIGGAIDRVHQPAMIVIRPFHRREFLAGNAPWAAGQQSITDQPLGFPVGIDIVDALEMLEGQGARFASGDDQVVENGAVIDCH